MKLLLDTNILIALTPRQYPMLSSRVKTAIRDTETTLSASVASLWEIAIKVRIGRLNIGFSSAELATFVDDAGLTLLPIVRDHVLAELDPEPATRDPFDRLLLAQCQVEGLRLVTLDRALATHPFAWR